MTAIDAGLTVLLIEDEESFVEALRVALHREGFEVVAARDGPDGLAALEQSRPDLVLLDIMLPGMSGIEICRKVRADSRVPIIMLTARDSEADTVAAFDAGADDYVTKPFRLRELIARMRATLRRAPGDESQPPGIVAFDDLVVDRSHATACLSGLPLPIGEREVAVLYALVSRAGRVVSRRTLADELWRLDHVTDSGAIEAHVKRLRAVIETDPASPRRIVAVRGVGYRFDPASDSGPP
jgi:two-component system response regulator RegX3